MRDHIKQRIGELKKDYEAGEARLAALDREAAQLRQTLLRISGAIQVLEETLAETAEDGPPDAKAAAE
jgi:predicted nuclease with TOPRIM domain